MAKPVFTSKDATQLLVYAEQIFLKMTENADLFANPVPNLATLEMSLNAYREAYAEAIFRDKRAVILKAQQGEKLQDVIRRLSHYVEGVAGGDEAIIVAAGFRPSRSSHVSLGRTPKPENLRIEHIQVGSGKIRLRVNSWRPARLYQYEYRKKGMETWEYLMHTKSTLELGHLDMLEQYEFRVSYIGSDVMLNYSDIVTAWVI
ncbi:fibronectin type III domain-containing protein [Sphingobacterium haloxyli]|uniref:Fibronectin type-III domain-containing protein n=1 Tax=Sphingobacterium haloxyli TaxID=2100533 RepID=A0A2S9J3I4_9SPHI|nr:fibronectin type III domain-containing protein [Sphingobacterium haloxyli]PRD47337.1 hypothetical protein C5745_10985 [Sphingobacterium haloxyli]